MVLIFFFFKHTIPFLLSPPPETSLGLTGLQTVFLEGSLVNQTSSVCDPLACSPSEGGMSAGTFWVLQASGWRRVWAQNVSLYTDPTLHGLFTLHAPVSVCVEPVLI